MKSIFLFLFLFFPYTTVSLFAFLSQPTSLSRRPPPFPTLSLMKLRLLSSEMAITSTSQLISLVGPSRTKVLAEALMPILCQRSLNQVCVILVDARHARSD